MADLYPMPLNRLYARAMAELKARDAIYDLGRRKWWTGDAAIDPSVSFLGRKAATAVGPAAGPQSQLVQNIVLAWLAGGRIFELKTVQIMDQLEIPRPCIDARNIGYNVEWSQELTLEASLAEYVGAWLLLHVLREIDPVGRRSVLGESCDIVTADPFVFDMSVGYDLKGIRSERVNHWIAQMRDATTHIDAMRSELPPEYRDIEVPGCISDSITLSTFHGCPPDEIERIGEHILDTLNMDLIVKLNPTLLGFERVDELVRGTLGYADVHPVKDAFDEDLQWGQALPLLQRLKALADRRGRQFGIKLTNTLVVENRSDYFSDERMYMSGQPLHVLAVTLLAALRKETDTVGDWLPVSFSAGIDRKNYPDAVAMGLTPVTTCTDLLRPGGYGRMTSYCKHLETRMKQVGATDVPSFIQKAYGHDGETPAAAAALNTFEYAEKVLEDARYHAKKNTATPKKIGSHLVLFDCINCDKCVPVCPNNANFAYEVHTVQKTYRNLSVAPDGTVTVAGDERSFAIEKQHQLACYTDFCNECGNCDIFCPEDGGPYIEKPLLFGSTESFAKWSDHDGYLLEIDESGARRFRGRMRGAEVAIIVHEDTAVFTDGIVEIPIDIDAGSLGTPRVVTAPAADHVVDLERAFALRAIYLGVYAEGAVNWPATLAMASSTGA